MFELGGTAILRRSMDKERIAEGLRLARNAASMTQKDAAEAMGVERQQITSWESGNQLIKLDAFAKLVGIYRSKNPEVSADEILGMNARELPVGRHLVDVGLYEQIKALDDDVVDEAVGDEHLNWTPTTIELSMEIPEVARVVDAAEALRMERETRDKLARISPAMVAAWHQGERRKK